MHGMKVRKIDELLLESEYNRIVKEFNHHVEIHVRFRQVVKKTGKTETYNTDKLRALNQYLDRKND